VPQKLAATFDYGTAAAHYLSASNPFLVSAPRKNAIGAVELLAQRVLLLLALLCIAQQNGPFRRVRRGIAVASACFAFLPGAWVGWVGLVVAALFLGPGLVASPAALLAVASVAMTAGVHAVFFGASRYTLVCLPAVAALAGTAFDRSFDSAGKVAG
jgi:hypothetical protein